MLITNKAIDSPDMIRFNRFINCEHYQILKDDPSELLLLDGIVTTDERKKLSGGNKISNGKYNLISITKDSMTILRDPFGMHHNLFYTQDNTISDSFEEVLELVDSPEMDSTGIRQFVGFEHTLGDKTFVKQIKYIMPCRTYVFSGEKVDQYEVCKYSPYRYQKGDIHEFHNLMLQSMHRIKKIFPGKTFGIGLSGGQDSKIVAYYAKEVGLPLQAFIFGLKDSDAFAISRRIADQLNIPLKILLPKKDFLQRYSEEQLNYNPLSNHQYLWYYSIKDELPEFDVLLTGFNGDNSFGSHLITDEEIENEIIALRIKEKYFNPYHSVFADDSDILDDIVNELPDSVPVSVKTECFNFMNRQQKFIKTNPSFNYFGKYLSVSPFEDESIIRYLLNLNYNQKKGMKFFIEFLNRVAPSMARIRGERTAYPLSIQNSFIQLLMNIVFMVDFHSGFNIIYPKSHKDIYYWLQNDSYFWKHILKVSVPHLDKLNIDKHNYITYINELRSKLPIFRRGKKIQPVFTVYSAASFLQRWHNDI